MKCLHLVGFRGDEYWSARRLYPDLPVFIHRVHDERAHRDFGEHDVIIFANDEREDVIRPRNAPDVVGFGYTAEGSIFTDPN